MTWRWTANRRPPHRISSPSHARLQTQALRVTPQPKPTQGGGLGVFLQPNPTHAPTQAPYPIVLGRCAAEAPIA
ncbi:hypothetical protein HanRHA438_Chr17g0820821 [Helianthus annuus]|nr:hypothetical protein HanRHA438_Chr17g0820821 [Helianthus annuus]